MSNCRLHMRTAVYLSRFHLFQELQQSKSNNGANNYEYTAAKGHNGSVSAISPGIYCIAKVFTAQEDQAPGQKQEISINDIKNLQNRHNDKHYGCAAKNNAHDTEHDL